MAVFKVFLSAIFICQFFIIAISADLEEDLATEQSKNHTILFRKWWNNIVSSYDNRVRPYFNVKPLRIALGLTILSISSISEASMVNVNLFLILKFPQQLDVNFQQWTVEMYFHEYWRDPRLYFNGSDFGKSILTLPQDAHLQIWTPDTSFINAIKSEVPKIGSVSHLSFLRVTEGGLLFWDRRLSVTATCHMDLTMYPFDQQACMLELSSFGHNTDGILYRWKSNPLPIDLLNISMPDYTATGFNSRVIKQKYVAGEYSVPQLCIVFKRRAGFCFLQMFIPATAVVGASWISLWLEDETQFADIVSIILAIIFLSYSYNAVMPKVSYIKAMDIYLGACFIFAFLSLAKLAVVKYMRKRVLKRRKYSGIMQKSSEGSLQNLIQKRSETRSNGVAGPKLSRTSSFAVDHHDVYWKAMKVFHVGSQLILPLAFVVFGVFYFFIYPYINATAGKCF